MSRFHCLSKGNLRALPMKTLTALMVVLLIGGPALRARAGTDPVHVRLSGFRPGDGGMPAGWKTWAPREELMPRTYIDTVHFRSGPGTLAINGNSNSAEFGGWEYGVEGIRPGAWYRTRHRRFATTASTSSNMISWKPE